MLTDQIPHLPETEWPAMLRREVPIAENLFLECKQEILSSYMTAMTPDSDGVIFAPTQHLMNERDRGKDVVEAMAITFASQGATEICLVSETWMVQSRDQAHAEEVVRYQREHGSLIDHPDRREYLLVTHFSLGGDVFASAEILSRRELGAWRCCRLQSSGRFTNIFLKAQARRKARGRN